MVSGGGSIEQKRGLLQPTYNQEMVQLEFGQVLFVLAQARRQT